MAFLISIRRQTARDLQTFRSSAVPHLATEQNSLVNAECGSGSCSLICLMQRGATPT